MTTMPTIHIRPRLIAPVWVLVALAAVGATPGIASAQNPVTPPPLTPELAVHLDSAITWPGAALVHATVRYHIAITTPVSRYWLANHAPDCADSLDAFHPPGFTADSGDVIEVTIVPAMDGYPAVGSCASVMGRAGAAVTRAGAISREFVRFTPQQDPTAVRIFRNRRDVATIDELLAPAHLELPRSARRPATVPHALRVFLAPGVVAPDRVGLLPNIQLRIAADDSVHLYLVQLPDSVVRQLWLDELGMALPHMRPSAPPAPMHVPEAHDVEVARGLASYQEGDVVMAAEILHARLYAGGLSPADLRATRTHLALSLLALGDTGDAHTVARAQADSEPCFSLAASAAPASVRAMFTPTKPSVDRCWSNVRSATLASALLPGLGQWRTGHHQTASIIFLGTAALIGRSATLAHSANGQYDQYQRARNQLDAQHFWTRADDLKTQSRMVALGAGVLWVGNIVESFLLESAHAHAHAGQADYGAAPGTSLLVSPVENGVGLGLLIATH